MGKAKNRVKADKQFSIHGWSHTRISILLYLIKCKLYGVSVQHLLCKYSLIQHFLHM